MVEKTKSSVWHSSWYCDAEEDHGALQFTLVCLTERIIESSQNHRIAWTGRELTDHLISVPLPWAGTPLTGSAELHPAWLLTLLTHIWNY